MWVDVLVLGRSLLPVPPTLALHPPAAALWELRVVVVEAAGVVGTERLLLGKDKTSDVYVRGWMSGMESDSQSTDVHFACLSGAAMWSWRMVFRFQHVWSENRVLVEEGRGVGRHPPRLHLALMDYDTFTSDDLLGTLSLDLSRLPRGAAFASNCTAKDAAGPTVNLFLARHAAGWWPALLAPSVAKPRAKGLGGKLRLELTLTPAAVADRNPAGRGREGPQALPKPQRPVEAFSMLRHPLMGVYHFVWRRHRRTLLLAVVVVLLVLFVLVAVYSLPGLLVKKIINA
ncbi:Otoferlin [Frankliniella fusca]|uniref:Otoferlin n=1 Tax=Frankliniella fusca TaxID=407009 RepID=A0AAE1I2F1_9NEOP|nr:Otoferlin [Frankliniella fusca]